MKGFIKTIALLLVVCLLSAAISILLPRLMKDDDVSAGKSAYELAVENGFNGTQEEWLASLIGSSGSGVKNAYVNDNMELVLEMSDGTTVNAGFIGMHVVCFNVNHPSLTLDFPVMQFIRKDGKVVKPTLERIGAFTLLGWYTDAACTTKYDFDAMVTGDLTLYASWRDDSFEAKTERQQEEVDNLKDLNGGTLPTIMVDSETLNPAFIDGAFSEVIVTDTASAIESLKDVENIMGFENVEEEYDDAGADTYEDITQYRLQQTYEGYTVFGQQIIVTTDLDGNTTALSGDYVAVGASLRREINKDATTAQEIAIATGLIDGAVQGKLVIYAQNGYCEFAYVFADVSYTVVVSAFDGAVLETLSSVMAGMPADPASITATIGRSQENSTDNMYNTAWFDFTDASLADTFIFYDTQRNILYHDLGHENYAIINENGEEVLVSLNPYTSKDPLSDDNNIWTDESAVKVMELYETLADVYDFYLNVLGIESYDRDGGMIYAYVNDGWDSGTNAFNSGIGSIGDKALTILSFGGVANNHRNIDTVAHEFTHAIQKHLVPGIQYKNETGALMEAYSDVMGELAEIYTTGSADWIHFDRNMKNPSSVRDDGVLAYPKKYNGAGYYTGESDNGGVHHNSTVISHAIYKVYNTGMFTVEEMTELLYRTWMYLNPTSDFYYYRVAMLAAANDMLMEQAKINVIVDAFDEANIKPTSFDDGFLSSVDVTCTVISNHDGTPVADAHILVKCFDARETIVASLTTDSRGKCDINLFAGKYFFEVTVNGYISAIDAFTFAPLTDYELSFRLIPEDREAEVITCEVGGVVKNALTGDPESDVTMIFREGYNVTSGRSVLTLTTGSSGEFYTDQLGTGFYTVELSKDGYIMSYVIMQAAASNWSEDDKFDATHQEITISPVVSVDNTLRIVLTWGQTPYDLDSHIWGKTSSGSSYHVYYSNPTAYDGSEKVADLDIDDTSSYGPETITLNMTNSTSIYSYLVHDFSNRGASSSRAMSNSSAKVMVYSGNVLIAVYEIPTNTVATVWHVFDYDPVSGQISFINQFKNVSDPEQVR